MLHLFSGLLTGTKLAAGMALVTVLIFGFWRWEVLRHDRTKSRLAAVELSNETALSTLARLGDLLEKQNGVLAARNRDVQQREKRLEALSNKLQAERSKAGQLALKAPFRLGDNQRGDLVRIMCLRQSCENGTDTRAPRTDDPTARGASNQ